MTWKYLLCLTLCLTQVYLSHQSSSISNSCISCIGRIEGGPSSSCVWDVNSFSCGKYQIKYIYFQDCYQSGMISDWKSCAFNEACARQCIRNYVTKYSSICESQLQKRTLTCQDFGRMHNGGPGGCGKTATLAYANKIASLCGM